MTVVWTITLIIMGLMSKVTMARPAEATPIATAAIGVMKPNNRQVAMIKTAAATSQLSALRFSDPMCARV
jgi:hypothetical protein